MPTRAEYFTSDRRLYTSPWFAGEHRIMLPFGCSPAPYYDPDPRCPAGQGRHHGIDVAMPCGTPLYAGLGGEILDAGASGTLGPAYGGSAFLIRDRDRGVDIVLGHAERLLVPSGITVRAGAEAARSGQDGAPDGCHLHFEVRPVGTPYTSAMNPRSYLRLTPH